MKAVFRNPSGESGCSFFAWSGGGGEDWKREAILDAKWGGSDVGCGSGVGTRVFGEKNHALWIGLERTP